MEASEDSLELLRASGVSIQLTEDHLQSLLSARRGREALLGAHLFSDPAWDILLELYSAFLGDRSVSVDDIARTTLLPRSVLNRWITALFEAQLIATERHPDGQEVITLTRVAGEKMATLANRWGSAFLSILAQDRRG